MRNRFETDNKSTLAVKLRGSDIRLFIPQGYTEHKIDSRTEAEMTASEPGLAHGYRVFTKGTDYSNNYLTVSVIPREAALGGYSRLALVDEFNEGMKLFTSSEERQIVKIASGKIAGSGAVRRNVMIWYDYIYLLEMIAEKSIESLKYHLQFDIGRENDNLEIQTWFYKCANVKNDIILQQAFELINTLLS